VPKFPLNRKFQSYWIRATIRTTFYLNSPFKDPISKEPYSEVLVVRTHYMNGKTGTIQPTQGLGLKQMNLERTQFSTQCPPIHILVHPNSHYGTFFGNRVITDAIR
jgi:hypothetical protein